MDRHIWESIIGFVPLQSYPTLPCPYCMSHSLSIDTKSINYRKAIHPETSAILAKEMNSKKQEVSDAFKENTFLGVLVGVGVIFSNAQKAPAKFICFFKCKNCGGDVSATGTSQHPISTNNQSSVENPLLKVEYFSPPVPIFKVSSSVPTPIKEAVLQSFNHFHSDISSSGAKLRRSIEKLCSELGFKERNLHSSISAMEKQFPKEAGLLQSLKLLGNEATHSDTVNEEDLLDAFEVQEFVLGMFERVEAEKLVEDKANKLRLKFDKESNKK
jgi:Domain of unknown function (DUF4145)